MTVVPLSARMLETGRCSLRFPHAADLASITAIYSDPAVRAFLGGPVEDAEIRKRFKARLESGETYWVATRKGDNSFLGEVSLDPHHDGADMEISYQFSPLCWGHGYASEAVKRIADYAVHELKLPRVVAETQVANTSSCRLLERIGMRVDREVERFGARQVIYVYLPMLA